MSLVLLSAGSNAHGQLGHSLCEDAHGFVPCQFLGRPPGSLPNHASRVLDVATGANHTLVLLEIEDDEAMNLRRREIWGCGDGHKGQLGRKYQLSSKTHGTDVFQRLELPLGSDLQDYEYKSIAAGWETSYVVLSPPDPTKGDVVFSFGCNDFGDLGVTGLQSESKAKASGSQDQEGQAEKLRRVAFDHILLDGEPITDLDTLYIHAVAASQHHVAILLEVRDGKRAIVGWGAARQGQLGPHSYTPNKPGTRIQKPIHILHRPHVVVLENPHDPFTSLAVGSHHTVLLCSSGKLVGLGSNRKGQLNVGDLRDVNEIACSWNGTFALVSRENEVIEVYGVGSDTHGQLGRGLREGNQDQGLSHPQPIRFDGVEGQYKPIKLSSGTEHVLTLWADQREDSEVWGWGWNEHGNLGLGHTNDVHKATKVWANQGSNGTAVNIWTGSGTSWLLCKTRGESN